MHAEVEMVSILDYRNVSNLLLSPQPTGIEGPGTMHGGEA